MTTAHVYVYSPSTRKDMRTDKETDGQTDRHREREREREREKESNRLVQRDGRVLVEAPLRRALRTGGCMSEVGEKLNRVALRTYDTTVEIYEDELRCTGTSDA